MLLSFLSEDPNWSLHLDFMNNAVEEREAFGSESGGGIVTILQKMNGQEDNDGELSDEPKRTQRRETEHMAASKSWDIIQAFQLASTESSSLPPSVPSSYKNLQITLFPDAPSTLVKVF